MYCDLCGREILCESEIGRIDKRRVNLAGDRHTTKTVICLDCVEDENSLQQEIYNEPAIQIEILHDKLAKGK
jgi:hypothetical protein